MLEHQQMEIVGCQTIQLQLQMSREGEEYRVVAGAREVPGGGALNGAAAGLIGDQGFH